MCICIVSFTLVSSLVISALLGSRLSGAGKADE